MKKRAAAYLRSSKDRADASIAAQERALRELATARGLSLVETFADAVESGKDDDRPGFQRLIQAVRNPARGWDTLLVLDTARIARRRLLAIVFEEQECKRHGVSIVYKSLPDGDPVTDMLVKSILQAMDEWHSLTSRAKGLAGMAENVRAGFRAGGRAPLGYRLAKVTTGAIREGMPVTKSRLEPDPVLAPKVAEFLKLRAAKIGRALAARQAGLKVPVTTLIGVERNALTYAGHTVWNVAGEKGSGVKRRPSSEWVVQENTHPALIDAETAAALVRAHDVPRAGRRQRVSDALLGGLLVSPEGVPWHSDGEAYRVRAGGRARTVSRALIEPAVVNQVFEDLRTPRLLSELTRQVQATLGDLEDTGRLIELRRQEADLGRRIASLLDLTTETAEPAPLLRRVEEFERQRAGLVAEIQALERDAAGAAALSRVTEAQVAGVLDTLAKNLADAPAQDLRIALEGLVEKVELDPETMKGRLHYRIGPSAGVKLASPRRPELIPGWVLRAVLPFQVRRAAARCAPARSTG